MTKLSLEPGVCGFTALITADHGNADNADRAKPIQIDEDKNNTVHKKQNIITAINFDEYIFIEKNKK
mgnify:CR=1 FL=1